MKICHECFDELCPGYNFIWNRLYALTEISNHFYSFIYRYPAYPDNVFVHLLNADISRTAFIRMLFANAKTKALISSAAQRC